MKVNGKDYPFFIVENNPFMFETTNQDISLTMINHHYPMIFMTFQIHNCGFWIPDHPSHPTCVASSGT